eukprot:gene17895-46089_t
MRAFAAVLLLPYAAGHGSMHWPPSRTGPGWTADSTLWFQAGCQAGCDKCVGGKCYGISAANAHEKCCDTVTPPTIANDSALRTYPIEYPNRGPFFGRKSIVSQYNPWRSPGFGP